MINSYMKMLCSVVSRYFACFPGDFSSSLRRTAGKSFFVTALLLQISILLSGVAYSENVPLYKDPEQPLEKRVEDIISRMERDEKIKMLGGKSLFSSPGVPRLGVPDLEMANGPSGVRPGPSFAPSGQMPHIRSTAFPSPISMAATWNRQLIYDSAVCIAKEARAKGKNVLLAPTVCIVRNPYGGRNFESYGEDPYLNSEMVIPFTKGVQKEGVITTTKHFVCNNQEYKRFKINEHVSKRAMHEIYLPAFRAAVEKGGAWGFMSAYPKVNGVYCSEDKWLLTDLLKKEWGFKGFVVSDWGAVKSTLPTLLGGLDLEMPSPNYFRAERVVKLLE